MWLWYEVFCAPQWKTRNENENVFRFTYREIFQLTIGISFSNMYLGFCFANETTCGKNRIDASLILQMRSWILDLECLVEWFYECVLRSKKCESVKEEKREKYKSLIQKKEKNKKNIWIDERVYESKVQKRKSLWNKRKEIYSG